MLMILIHRSSKYKDKTSINDNEQVQQLITFYEHNW